LPGNDAGILETAISGLRLPDDGLNPNLRRFAGSRRWEPLAKVADKQESLDRLLYGSVIWDQWRRQHIRCGADGWGHLTAVIDRHDREVTGYEFALRGRAKEAERALEEACLARFGTLRPAGSTSVIRSDNGLIFQSRRFRAACHDYRLRQEFITPYTPEQNGLIERFFRSLKEECVWLHNFGSFSEARAAITKWIHWYNAGRPHQALGYRSPRQFRALQPQLVA